MERMEGCLDPDCPCCSDWHIDTELERKAKQLREERKAARKARRK